MSRLRDLILKVVVWVTYRVSNSSIGKKLHASPLKDRLQRTYRWIVDTIRSNQYRLTIEGVTASFRAENPEISRKLIHLREVESPVLIDLISELREDDIVYDIGAHLGLYSCFASQVVSQGTVVAFEPFPPSTEELRSNCRINENIVVVEAAITDHVGEVELYFGDDAAGNPKPALHEQRGSHSIIVESTSLDRYVEESGMQPTVLKIDVEGSEMGVLRGGMRTLSSSAVRVVYCELHAETDEEMIVDILSDAGFEIDEIDVRRQERFIKGYRKESV